jgi:hypothetical protein
VVGVGEGEDQQGERDRDRLGAHLRQALVMGLDDRRRAPQPEHRQADEPASTPTTCPTTALRRRLVMLRGWASRT